MVYFVIGILIVFLIFELYTYIELRKIFTCENCGKLNNKIYRGVKCSDCNKKLKKRNKSLRHFVIRYTNVINTRLNNIEYRYNEHRNVIFLESLMIVSLIVIMILTKFIK